MIRLSFLLLASAIFMACGNNDSKKGEVTITSEDGKEKTTINTEDAESKSEAMQRQVEELQKLEPISIEQLKAMMPEELMGAKRTKWQATNAAGTGMASAEYVLNDSTELKVNIFDCGGPGGAGIYSLQYMTMFNYESESDDEYTRSIEFDGKRGFEQCNKTNNNCKLTYFAGKRFMISLDGDNLSADELKKVADNIIE